MQESIRVDVEVVNVLCTVRDRNGALVKNLAKDDFEIREDGKPQQVRYFAQETDLPLTIGLLVDAAPGAGREGHRGALPETGFAASGSGSLIGFSNTVVLWQDFTNSLSALESLHAVPFRGVPREIRRVQFVVVRHGGWMHGVKKRAARGGELPGGFPEL